MPRFEKGKYKVKVKSWGFKEAQSGNLQWFATFDVVAKYLPKDLLEDVVEQERTGFYPLTENTVKFTNEMWKKMGWTGKDSEELFDMSHPNAPSWEGAEFDAVCNDHEYNGSVKEEWKFYFKGNGVQGISDEKVKKTAVSRLNAMFKGVWAEDGNKSVKPESVSNENESPSNDDVPF